MSQEGIRIVNPDDALRDRQAEQKFSPDAVTPMKVRVKKSEGAGVEIDWRDGHVSAWSFRWLRDACPCATCHEEREQNGRAPGVPKPKAQGLLQMYQEPPRPIEVSQVGKYALRFKWTDGHEAGIYSWDYLRRFCDCQACREARASG